MSISILFAQSNVGVLSQMYQLVYTFGANVYLAGTSMGSATDTDGAYSIKNVGNGNYTLVQLLI